MKKSKIIAASICAGIACLYMSITGFSVLAAEQTASVGEEQEEECQYGAGSVSKTFTAVAVMQLVDEGKVELDEPVVTYIPEFTMEDERYRDITVRMLLNHTSGLMGSLYHNGDLFEAGNAETHDRLLEALSTQTLKADPGSYLVYSNDGFILAEILVEKVTGMSFMDYIEQNICQPLQMEHTSTSATPVSEEADVKRARNYVNETIQVPYECVTEAGSGGIQSTTQDLAKFSTIFMKDGSNLLSKDAVKEMCKDYYADTTYLKLPELEYKTTGLGFDYVNSYEFEKYGIKAIGKGGDLTFHHANLTILPEQNMSAAVLSSAGGSTFNQLVAQAVLLAALEVRGEVPEGTASQNQLQEWKQTISQESCEIPENILSCAGNYIGKHAVSIRFPDSERMELTTLDREAPITMKFSYHEDGWFYGDDKSCIGHEIMNAGDGHIGISKVRFVTEQDGSTYLYASTNAQYSGLGMYGYEEVFARKAESDGLDDAAQSAWEQRVGNTYYLYNDRYSSTEWASSSNIKIEIKDIGVKGYVYGTGFMGAKRIIDENHLESACIGRDMSRVSVKSENGQEVLSFDDGGSTFISEKDMQELTEEMRDYELENGKCTQWFQIPDSLAKKQIIIQVTGNAMAAVYDKYGQCIYTSFAANGDNSVILPRGGKLVFAGEKSDGKNPSVHFDYLK